MRGKAANKITMSGLNHSSVPHPMRPVAEPQSMVHKYPVWIFSKVMIGGVWDSVEGRFWSLAKCDITEGGQPRSACVSDQRKSRGRLFFSIKLPSIRVPPSLFS